MCFIAQNMNSSDTEAHNLTHGCLTLIQSPQSSKQQYDMFLIRADWCTNAAKQLIDVMTCFLYGLLITANQMVEKVKLGTDYITVVFGKSNQSGGSFEYHKHPQIMYFT